MLSVSYDSLCITNSYSILIVTEPPFITLFSCVYEVRDTNYCWQNEVSFVYSRIFFNYQETLLFFLCVSTLFCINFRQASLQSCLLTDLDL